MTTTLCTKESLDKTTHKPEDVKLIVGGVEVIGFAANVPIVIDRPGHPIIEGRYHDEAD